VKAPELKGLDSVVNGCVGWFKNRRPVLSKIKAQVARIEQLEESIRNLGASRFREAVEEVRDAARCGRLEGQALDRAVALAREATVRSIGKRPYPVQLMGALAMIEGYIAEMATGEGKTITAGVACSVLALQG